jgi:hypothetical protein
MQSDPVEKLIARIEKLERLFASLQADPASAAWRAIESQLAASGHDPALGQETAERQNAAGPQDTVAREEDEPEPRAFIRGGYGEEMDVACSSVASFFQSLPGWREEMVNADEVVYLAGFFAFIALASSPSAPLGRAEAATGARATVARRLMVRQGSTDGFSERLGAFKARLNEYSSLWAGVLKGQNSFGAFGTRAFENVRIGGRTRDGYLEHLNGFPEFCERRIRGFHDAVAPNAQSAAPRSEPSATGRAKLTE